MPNCLFVNVIMFTIVYLFSGDFFGQKIAPGCTQEREGGEHAEQRGLYILQLFVNYRGRGVPFWIVQTSPSFTIFHSFGFSIFSGQGSQQSHIVVFQGGHLGQ